MYFSRIIEFSGNHLYLVLAFLGTLGVLIATEISRRTSGMQAVGPVEATRLNNHQDAIFLDIRDDAEYKTGYLPDSVHIPLKQLPERVQELNKYRQRPVIAYCRSGNRSNAAGRVLRKQGFEKVYNLAGGILEWQKAGLPTRSR